MRSICKVVISAMIMQWEDKSGLTYTIMVSQFFSNNKSITIIVLVGINKVFKSFHSYATISLEICANKRYDKF